ncbi:hypothetical protein HQQ81_22260 [Microbacteriaceae bacterium VKM Ac-2854]|nr:hypothetical protein [Microbacteriaceae bacterium VKM Ac-2854]
MSGSNGPDYSSSGGGSSGTDCSGYRNEKPLQAPNEDVVPTLSVGEDLYLALRKNPVLVIAVITADGREAGSIMPDVLLISCLQQGVAYTATVRSIRGGHIMLAIAAQ